MEFERAIYRVYERCLEGIRDDDNEDATTAPSSSKSCRFLEIFSLVLAVGLLIVLVILHVSFVNTAGCLPQFVTMDAVDNTSSLKRMREDSLLYIRVQSNLLPDHGGVLSDQANSNRAASAILNWQLNQHWSSDSFSTNTGVAARSAAQHFSRSWLPAAGNALAAAFRSSDSKVSGSRSYLRKHSLIADTDKWRYSTLFSDPKTVASVGEDQVKEGDSGFDWKQLLPYSSSGDMNTTAGNSTEGGTSGKNTSDNDDHSDNTPAYDYLFTLNAGLLLLSNHQLRKHNFEQINITLSGSQCFGSTALQSLIPIGGVDTVVLNFLMQTVQDAGHVLTRGGEYFKWSWRDLRQFDTIADWLAFKFNMLISSCLAFFFLSTITALLVRALISSGVVLMFPLFGLLRLCGLHGINLRIISVSYPWIGIPLEMIRARNQPMWPFIIAHITRIVVYYFMYQATQIVYTVWFYNRDSPGQQELWVFAVMMLWEYYSMIYVRSAASIRLFPRASFALFLLYHFYYYSFPGGFHVLALVVMFCFLMALMVYCIRVFELKAFHRGQITFTQPRMLYNALPWPSLRPDLAPEYTLFMPVNSRTSSAYQGAVPRRPGTTDAGDAPAAATAAVDATNAAAAPQHPASPAAAGGSIFPNYRRPPGIANLFSNSSAGSDRSNRYIELNRTTISAVEPSVAGSDSGSEVPADSTEEAQVSLLSRRDGGYDGDEYTRVPATADAANSGAGGSNNSSFFSAVANTAMSVTGRSNYSRLAPNNSHDDNISSSGNNEEAVDNPLVRFDANDSFQAPSSRSSSSNNNSSGRAR